RTAGIRDDAYHRTRRGLAHEPQVLPHCRLTRPQLPRETLGHDDNRRSSVDVTAVERPSRSQRQPYGVEIAVADNVVMDAVLRAGPRAVRDLVHPQRSGQRRDPGIGHTAYVASVPQRRGERLETARAFRETVGGGDGVDLEKEVVASEDILDVPTRSEERRVGKECGARWSPTH